MKTTKAVYLTDAQLKEELDKCEFCEEKPCKDACPVDCSPADFIMAAKRGEKADYTRTAALIMGNNPLGGICGAVCPDTHCMSACVHKKFNSAVNIPMVQATLIAKAKELKALPKFKIANHQTGKIAIIGGGPAGLGAASVLAQQGFSIDIFEETDQLGGMCNLIPDFRLDKKVLQSDIKFLMSLGKITPHFNVQFSDPVELFDLGYKAVVIAGGLNQPFMLNIPGKEEAIDWKEFLTNSANYDLKKKKVIIVGGGAIALDCAETAKLAGASHVELITLENIAELPLTAKERNSFLEFDLALTTRTKVEKIISKDGKKIVSTSKVELMEGKKFHPTNMTDVPKSSIELGNVDLVIFAIGSRSNLKFNKQKGIFLAGDMLNGPTTVVEAVASGKNAALEVLAYLAKKPIPKFAKHVKSKEILHGRNLIPVDLSTDFFGRKIISPFLLSAAPPSDGYEQMKKAYEAGWAGGIMKTAFDGIPIHIPGEYMFAFTENTYANCDNVSGHSLDRVCAEIKQLIEEFPDRLTLASTGGPVTGNDAEDKKGWQHNTLKLEKAGVMGIEYSLSCPQGGDGTKGDIVSQDPELTATIIDWVMEVSDPEIPKLFKLTGAVTAIYPIVAAIKEVFAKYPNKKAGVTLANTFPTLSFRKGEKETWEEGIIVGMSGEGVIPISNLTLANVSAMGVTVSGNGGPMDYKSAADFLALGAKTVQFCTVAMKYGYNIIEELHSGLSYLLQERGISSVSELIGYALPNPVTGFMELTPIKKISAVQKDICEHCGNCTRCPYLAITLNKDKVPQTDPSKCIGCSICVQKCFSGALYMRERNAEEMLKLKEE